MPVPNASPLKHLNGLRVLDLASNIAGSRAAGLLAEAGARVVKIRPPGANLLEATPTDAGDPPATGILWDYANRGKETWSLDHQSTVGRGKLLSALSRIDVLVHNMNDEEAQKLELDYDRLSAANPRLVVVSVTPYGASGPRSAQRADDLVALATSGLMYSTPGFPDFVEDTEKDPPLRPSADLAELITGVVAAAGCLEAVLQRDGTGKGDFVDVSYQEAIASLLAWDYALFNYGGVIAGRVETRAGLSPNAFLPCRDGWVVMVAFNQRHWEALVEMMGHPDWSDSELFATPTDRGENWDALKPLLEMWLAGRDRLEVMNEAQSLGIPTCAVLEADEAFDNEQVRSRKFYVETKGGQVPGSALVVNGERVSIPSSGETGDNIPFSTDDEPPWRRDVVGDRALSGVRIIDFGHMVAVPLAAQWLALMGAELIQVESHHNMVTRQFAPIIGEPPWNTSGFYNHINNNKKSVTLNLRDPKGVELARRLVAQADVVMENYSIGTMEKLGLGYEDLKRVKPDVIMLSMSAFGSDGPWASYNALHSGVLSLSGLAALTGYEGGHARMCGSILPDVLASCAATFAVAQAVYDQRRTGEGQHVELAMSEVVQALLPEPIYELTRFGKVRSRMGNRHPRQAPHGVYRTVGEDRWLAISVRSDDDWIAFCDAIERPQLASDDRFRTVRGRLDHSREVDAEISVWSKDQDANEAAALLQHHGVLAGPVLNVGDLLADEHLVQRGFVQDVEHPQAGRHPMVARPWRLRSGGEPTLRHAPLLGGDNVEVLNGLLGLAPQEIARLESEKVVY